MYAKKYIYMYDVSKLNSKDDIINKTNYQYVYDFNAIKNLNYKFKLTDLIRRYKEDYDLPINECKIKIYKLKIIDLINLDRTKLTGKYVQF